MVGYFDGVPEVNPEEVASFKWMSLKAIKEDIELHPNLYTAWFKIIFKESYSKLSYA